jgi:hypothetical protein
MLRDGAPEQPVTAQKPAPSANRLHPLDMSVEPFGYFDGGAYSSSERFALIEVN